MRKAFVEIKTAKKRAGEDVMSRMERIERRRGVKGGRRSTLLITDRRNGLFGIAAQICHEGRGYYIVK